MAYQPQSSPLLLLPMELRLSILESLIPQSSTSTRIAWSNKPASTSSTVNKNINPCQPAIALTCRQLRQDTLPIFYARTHFTLHVPQPSHFLSSTPTSESTPSATSTTTYLTRFTLTPGFPNIQTICISTGSMEFAFDLKKGALRMRSWKGRGERSEYEGLSRRVDGVLEAWREGGSADRMGLLVALVAVMEKGEVV